MVPLQRVVVGLLIVFVDLRLEELDILLDPVGWVLALTGLVPLVGRHPGFLGAAIGAAMGLVVSVLMLVDDNVGAVELGDAAAHTVVVFGTCTALLERATKPSVRRAAGIIRWIDLGVLGLWVALYFGMGEREVDVTGAARVPFVLLILVVLALAVWYLVVMWRARADEPFRATARA